MGEKRRDILESAIRIEKMTEEGYVPVNKLITTYAPAIIGFFLLLVFVWTMTVVFATSLAMAGYMFWGLLGGSVGAVLGKIDEAKKNFSREIEFNSRLDNEWNNLSRMTSALPVNEGEKSSSLAVHRKLRTLSSLDPSDRIKTISEIKEDIDITLERNEKYLLYKRLKQFESKLNTAKISWVNYPIPELE